MPLAFSRFVYVLSAWLAGYVCIFCISPQARDYSYCNTEQLGIKHAQLVSNAVSDRLFTYLTNNTAGSSPGKHYTRRHLKTVHGRLHISSLLARIGYVQRKLYRKTKSVYTTRPQIQPEQTSKFAKTGIKKGTDKIEITDNDEEDEDVVSLKKDTDAGKYFISPFYAQQPSQHFHRYNKNALPFCKDFSYFSSCRYITMCVMRI